MNNQNKSQFLKAPVFAVPGSCEASALVCFDLGLFSIPGSVLDILQCKVVEKHEFRVCMLQLHHTWQPYIGSANALPDIMIFSGLQE